MRYFLSFVAWIVLFSGCSSLNRTAPEISVGINSFRVLPSQESMVPQFEIGLHIVNTGPSDIDIRGIVYKIYLQEHKIVTGAARDLPKIPAYGESDVLVKGRPDIFETIGFFREMMERRNGSIDYLVDVGIDVGSWIPMIHTKKEGKIDLAIMNQR
jgi:LEA14-like dessication related protein